MYQQIENSVTTVVSVLWDSSLTMIALSLHWQRFARWWRLKGKRSPGLRPRFHPVWRWTASWSERWTLPSRQGSCSSDSSLGHSQPCCGSSTRNQTLTGNVITDLHSVRVMLSCWSLQETCCMFFFFVWVFFCDELWFVDIVSWQTFSCCRLSVFVCLRETKLHTVIADYLNISAQCFVCNL